MVLARRVLEDAPASRVAASRARFSSSPGPIRRGDGIRRGHSFTRDSRAALRITDTDDAAMAAAAIIGLSSQPVSG